MQKLFKRLYSQQGMSSVYIIIVIIILALGITLSGGSASLFTGNMADPAPPTPTPAATDSSSIPSGTTTPTGTSSTGAWNITATLSQCVAAKPPHINGTIKVDGSESGYIELSVDNPKKIIGTQAFTPPTGNFPVTLTNDSNFNASTWRFAVFSGGTVSEGKWSGGTLRKVYVGLPTGCT